jgi:hypothetical protein
MTDISIQKVKQKLKKPLQVAKEEIGEMQKSASSQIGGEDKSGSKSDQQDPITEAMLQKSDDTKSNPRKFKSLRDQQEEEIRLARQRKEELEKLMRESRDPDENEEIESKPGSPIESVPMPASKPSRGMLPGHSKSPEKARKKH